MRSALILTTALMLAGLAACDRNGDQGAMAGSCQEMMAESPQMMRGMMGTMMADSVMRDQMMGMMMENPEMRRMMMRRMMADSEAHQEMIEMIRSMPRMEGMQRMEGMEGMPGMPRDTAR
jgi:hypothetical protein